MSHPAGQEVILYQDADVVVTTGRFSVGQKMYPIRNLTSVEAAEHHTPANRSGAYLAFLLALSSGCLVNQSATPIRPLLILTVPLVALGVFLWRRAKPKAEWIVRIHTAGVQANAYTTNDKSRRDAILAALHSACAG